jgi:hypothetical protein
VVRNIVQVINLNDNLYDVVCSDRTIVSFLKCAGGIFVKLTRDFAGIYGGDMGAAKAAKHEIRSLRELISCNIPKLFFPMLCIVDYLVSISFSLLVAVTADNDDQQ